MAMTALKTAPERLCSPPGRPSAELPPNRLRPFMNIPIVVVGSYVQDLSFACERFASAGETVVGRFVTGPGGKGSNQAVAAGRAGAPALFIGAVGRDAFAAEAKRFYRAEGIGARFVEKTKHATAAAAIVVNRE